MTRLEAVLDHIVEKALDKALATLEERAATLIVAPLEEALRRRVEALLGEVTPEAPVPEALAIGAPTRARAKVAQATLEEATQEEATQEEAKPRKRAKARATQTLPQEDLETILEGVKLALAKYEGAFTPRGKALPDVLYRRVRKVLQHAQSLGRADLAPLARSALAVIVSDPRGVAMSSWQALAGRLGLPIPIQGGGQ